MDGTVVVQFQGVPGVVYRVEYSDSAPEDLTQWKIAVENLVAGTGWTEWIDTTAGQVAQRVYRVVPQSVTGSPPVFTATTNVVETIKDQGIYFIVDTNTVQAAQAIANESWARLKEASDAGKLVGALGAGNYDTAVEILREYGIEESTLKQMRARMGQPIKQSVMKDKFIRGVVSLPLDDPKVKQHFQTASSMGRGRLYWTVKSLGPDWMYRYDKELAQLPEPPMAVLDVKLQEIDIIRFFKWYDRYGDRVHSVLVNSDNLGNFALKDQYADAQLITGGLFKLIKARNPEAFVWVRVVWQEDKSDVRWLKAMGFKPDGIVVWNLHSYMSPFERARMKYVPIVGESTPMMVAEFYGFWPQVTMGSGLAEIGKIIKREQERMEERLQEWGYCGLMTNWRLVEAVNQATK